MAAITWLLVAAATLVAAASGEDCTNRCSWIEWQEWSSCTETCGGGTRNRTRALCCRRGVTDFAECADECGLDGSAARQLGDCQQSCYHGNFVNNSCHCNAGYYGRCCNIRVCCADPEPLENGQVTGTDFCYGGIIEYTCNQHYNLTNGPHQQTCLSIGRWSLFRPTCTFVNTCANISCQNGGTCINGLNRYTCDCRAGWSGSHCEIDTQPPTVSECAHNFTYTTDKSMLDVTWPEPVFWDARGSPVDVTSNFNGTRQILGWGQYTVQYTGTKRTNGVKAKCVFTLDIYPLPCDPPPTPTHGVYACNGWNGRLTRVCALLCPSDRDVRAGVSIGELYVCGGKGVWVPTPTSQGCSEARGLLATEATPPELEKHYFPPGDCMNSLAAPKIKENYLSILNNSSFSEMCEGWDTCSQNNVQLYC